MYNVIGDIAGQYKTLQALIAKMPPAPIMSVGDMIDRGPDSDKVVKYFMETPEAVAILGNHEHMMVDYYEKLGFYGEGIWQCNGGIHTQRAYGFDIPSEVIKWAMKLPKFRIVEVGEGRDKKKYFISHSFLYNKNKKKSLNFHPHDFEDSIIWNRWQPERVREYDLQISGHNSQWGLRRWIDDRGDYALSIDTSQEFILTGIHLPTMKVYQQAYIK